MTDASDSEALDVGELSPDDWNEYAISQGWSDGLPLVMPTEAAVEKFVAAAGRVDNSTFQPISPRQVVPTLRSLAANAVMAGCKPEYFPVVLAGLRSVLSPDYHLHGTLATTHPCAQLMVVSGPLRTELDINCGSNCLGQGRRANATIGRALQLILLNGGGAKPGDMDRATQGSPAKFAYCLGENEEASPWEPYHVRKGFAATDSVVTCMAAEAPHNINDHASNTGEGLVTTVAGTMSQVGTNNTYLKGPCFVVLGPEHAQTMHRDGWTPKMLQEALYERSRIHVSRISKENLESWAGQDRHPVNGHYYIGSSPDDISVIVAGGPGKHSVFIPSFGNTAASSSKVTR
ncbi:MAG TPA: hypothetical protein VFV47_12100 [Hyphomicrobiaceae bacterium]|nr:hypothetical protein [Hyphomicrobiaceae bacterium]